MNTSIEHLIPSRRLQLQSISKIIQKTIRPEKIILYGNHAASYDSIAFRLNIELPECLLNYDILVVTRRGDLRHDYEVQDIVENRCQTSSPVNIIVHDMDYVNEQIAAGHYFFSMLSAEGILLYDAGNIPFAEKGDPDLKTIRAIAEKDFQGWWHRADAFLRSALFNINLKERRIAIFLLHQAAEQGYQAILLAFMGYKPCTHNLDKLRRYTNRFSVQLAMLFPRDTPREDRLFKVLSQSYVDARYKEDFNISEEELRTLGERVDRLLSIATKVCRNRFVCLQKMATAC